MIQFDREKFFDSVRPSLFSGKLSQQQVDGMNFKLDEWCDRHSNEDIRWCAYAFATSYHETSQKMWPIEEYGKGAGMAYGKPDPVTGKAYYGRGDVQLTWKENYERATKELGLSGADDLVLHPEKALHPQISADVMYLGMIEGWFRKGQTLGKYFNANTNDPFGAREIINGDKTKVPSWSNGVNIGNLISGYYSKFLTAMNASIITDIEPEAEPVVISINFPTDSGIVVKINGKLII